MRIRSFVALSGLTLIASFAGAQDKKPSVEADRQLIQAVQPSLAVAEISVRPDNGEEPYGGGWGSQCPSCGQVHTDALSTFIEQERPMEMPAFVVADDMVLIPDPGLHARFIGSVKVRQGKNVVDAAIDRWFVDRRAVALKLNGKLDGAKPLEFVAAPNDKLRIINYVLGNGHWQTTVGAFPASVTQTANGPRNNSLDDDTLIVTPEGKAVGLSFSDSLPVDDSWKVSPMTWKSRSALDQAEHQQKIESTANAGIVRVHLSFRSPKANPNDQFNMRRNADPDAATERHVHGVVVAPNRVLVLANLKPETTARLERITVYPRAGEKDADGVGAKFLCTIKDYAALMVETDKPLDGVLKPTTLKPEATVGPELTLAEVRLQGENRTTYVSGARFSGLNLGWRRNVYPSALVANHAKESFVFDDQAQLVALPVLVRPKPTSERSYRQEEPGVAFYSQLAEVIADPMSNADKSNIPLSAEEENRLAWLGVELQPLTPELARLNKVSQLTNDGESGALVTYVYANSPAAKAGIEVGAVVLRLHVPDQPMPIDVAADQFMFAERDFPWAQYDQFPEAYFDRMPHPWPTVATSLAKTLTELGFGKTVTLEFFQAGKVEKRPIEIAMSPTYYDTAKKQKHAPSGLTLKEMTFELRRYFHLQDDQPGLIISAIEQGSRASKAGLKPYEYITAVNGTPVKTPDDFTKAADGQTELRLDVVRMNKSRVVKVQVDLPKKDDATTQPATQPAAEGAK